MTAEDPAYLMPVRLRPQPTCICVASGTAARKVPGLDVLVSEWMAIGDALDAMRRLTPSNSTHSTEKTWLPDRLSLGTGSDAGWVLQLDRVRHQGESGFRSGGWAIRLKCSPNVKEVYERCR